MKTSRYEAIKWLQQLYERGIRTYFFSEVPEDMREQCYQRKAIVEQLVSPTGVKTSNGIRQWRIHPEILNITGSNQKWRYYKDDRV